MHVYESNNIRVSGYPLPLKLKIVDDLTIDNPAYLKAKYQRRPTWGIDQKLQLFTYDNDGSLILPRGYADRLYNLIPETTTSVKWDKEQVEGEPVDFGPWNENFQIRDYQHPLIDSLLRKNGIGVSPAGSGKTIMGMRYIYEVGRPTLWLTHTRDLVYQTRDRALSTLKGVGRVGILGDGVEDFGDRKLIIATVQTLKAKQRLVEKLKEFIGVVVIDEAHHFPSTQFLDTAAQFPAKRIVGLTATPKRKDEMEQLMYLGIGPVLHEVPRTALYKDDQLVLPEVKFIYTSFTYGNEDSADGNIDAGGEDLDYQDILYRLFENEDRLNLVAQSIVDAVKYGQSIVLSESVRYCFKLKEKVDKLLLEQGYRGCKTAVVHGGLTRYSWKVAGGKRQAEALAADYGTECKYDGKARRWKVKTPQYTEEEFKKWQVTKKKRQEILDQCREVYKHIAGYLRYRLGEVQEQEDENGRPVEYTEPLKAVDLVVYTVKRMLRLPYSRHQKTGLYKIELTLQQLKELTLDEIKERARTGQPIQREEKTVRKRPKAGVFYADKLHEYEEAAATVSDKRNKTEYVFVKDKPPVCVEDILNNGWKKDGDRNNATVQLCCYFKAAGYKKEEATSILEDWVVKFTSADSRYSIQQRKANTRNVIESVYGSEKDYQFGCAFIRSLHGEKKKGDNDYDRVPCAGGMCPCIKGNTDVAEEAINLPLAKTSDASLTGKLITTRVMVAGKKHTPYVVPKKVEYSCWGQEKCKKYGCPLLNIPTATAYKELNAHNRELIQMTETGDDNIKGILREISGIPSCGKYDTSIVETINVDELLVIPMAEEDGVKEDDTGSYVLRKIYAIGGMKIETNKYYEISGYMYRKTAVL